MCGGPFNKQNAGKQTEHVFLDCLTPLALLLLLLYHYYYHTTYHILLRATPWLLSDPCDSCALTRSGLLPVSVVFVFMMVITVSLSVLDVPQQHQQAHAQTALDEESSRVAILETDMGVIVIEFFPNDAPNHVANFVELAESGFYDDTLFHRIIPGFMIQGGDPNTIDGPPNTWGTGGPPQQVDAEFNDIEHDRGIVSMARSQNPNSAGSQFFIVHQDSNFLDGQYTVFGRIVTDSSFETLDAIANVPTGAQDRPVDIEAVRITSVTVVDRSTVPDILTLLPPERVVQSPTSMPPPVTTTPTGVQIYDSKELGIAFEAPAGWLLQEPRRTNSDAPDVVAVGQRQDGGIPQIYIYVDDTQQQTLQEIIDGRLSTIQGILSEEDFATLEQKPATVSGFPAHEIQVTESVTLNNMTVDVKLVEILVYGDNDKYYTLSYANIPQNFDDSLPHFEQVLETFAVAGMITAKGEDDNGDASEVVPSDEDDGDNDMDGNLDENDSVVAATDNGGGCLVATAAFGSEMAPQVQTLRELRDTTIMSTQSGTAFMSGFNTIYYSFSPFVADMEREHPVFRDAVRAFITPMISSLSVMSMADAGSDRDVVAYGIIVIMLNVGLYVVSPIVLALAGIKAIKAQRRRMASLHAPPLQSS